MPAVEVPVDEKVIGERIRELRKRPMSQAELAAELGIDQTAVSDSQRAADHFDDLHFFTATTVIRTNVRRT